MVQSVIDVSDIIVQSLVFQKFNVDIPITVTSQPSTPQISYSIGNFPALLMSASLLWDSNFADNYSYIIVCDGINGTSAEVAVGSGNELCPDNKVYLIPAGSTLRVYAWNSTSYSGSDGHISIQAVFSVISHDMYEYLFQQMLKVGGN